MRNYKDWVQVCTSAVPGTTTPDIFRRWAALAAVSGALGRKCWLDMGEYVIRPNLYICLVARPGCNKSVSMKLPLKKVYSKLCAPIAGSKGEKDDARLVWSSNLERENPPLWMIQDRVTPEKLARTMANNSHYWYDLDVSDSNMLLVTDEFGTFMERGHGYLQTFLTRAWDSDEKQEAYTKNAGDDVIKGPYLTWVSGATPEEFVNCMPANANQQGLLSRMLPVYYEGPKIRLEVGQTTSANEQDIDWLTTDLARIANLQGPFIWGEGVKEKVQELIDGTEEEISEPMMREYATRRHAHVLKVAMCISAARRNTLKIEVEDFDTAVEWVREVEENMPPLLARFGMSEAGKLVEELVDFVKTKPNGVSYALVLREAIRKARSVGEAEVAVELLKTSHRVEQTDSLVKAI